MPENKKKYTGAWCPSITPFDADGKLDLAALEKHFSRLSEAGTDGVLLMGSIGEFTALSMDERVSLIHAARTMTHLPLIANVSGTCMEDMTRLADAAYSEGYEAVMALPHYYFAQTPRQLEAYFDTLGGRFEGEWLIYLMGQINPDDYESLSFFSRVLQKAGVIAMLEEKGAKDGDTVWNPGWQPTQTELDEYECRHGLGYTILRGSKNGIAVRQEMLVPKGDNCLLTRLTVTNESDAPRTVSLFPYAEFCLWDAMDDSSNFQRNFSIGEVELEPNAIYHKTEYRERRDHYAVLWADRPYEGFDTSRDAFMGVYGAPSMPQAVKNGACTGSVAHGWAPVGAMQFTLSLAPGASQTLLLGLGYIENPEDAKWSAPGVINKEKAHAMMEHYSSDAAFDRALAALWDHWSRLLDGYQVSSGDEKLDRMVNIWNQYQCMVTFNMSRSASYFESGMGRGMGFRDSCQDLLGFVHMIPQRARERILDIAATQFPDGSAYHQYQPLTKKGNLAVGSGFNDDPLWLIAGTDAYLRETGDWTILDEPAPFDTKVGTEQPLLAPLRRRDRDPGPGGTRRLKGNLCLRETDQPIL